MFYFYPLSWGTFTRQPSKSWASYKNSKVFFILLKRIAPLHDFKGDSSRIFSLISAGPPDVDQPCEPSLQAWSPELHLNHMNMTVPCPAEGCSLELLFQHPVQADTLTLWVTYLSVNSSKAFFDIEILLEHKESMHLGPLNTFCDMPLTVKLHVDEKVVGAKVYTFDERMEIDAALLTSRPSSSLCSGCRPVSYQVLREPPFSSGSPMVVTHPHRKFTDT